MEIYTLPQITPLVSDADFIICMSSFALYSSLYNYDNEEVTFQNKYCVTQSW